MDKESGANEDFSIYDGMQPLFRSYLMNIVEKISGDPPWEMKNPKKRMKRGLMVMACGHITTFLKYSAVRSPSTKIFRSLVECKDCWAGGNIVGPSVSGVSRAAGYES